jgi:NADH-quinone oxidoreductase subunit H
MTLERALIGLLIFPGVLYAVPMAWLMAWIYRKVTARIQGRIGPPLLQPIYDFLKLLAKQPVPRPPMQGFVMTSLPVFAAGTALGAIALLPILPAGGFAGDLILLVALIEVAPLAAVFAGFASRSLFGSIGGTREAVLVLAYNLPFLTALFALSVAAGSFSLAGLVAEPLWVVRVPVLLALLLTMPVKLHINPFSTASAEQEIYTGATTEYDGPRLALWEFAHALEWVVVTGLWAALVLPTEILPWPVRILLFSAISVVLAVVLTTVSAATARLKIMQVSKFYWLWGFGVALVALLIALIQRWGA